MKPRPALSPVAHGSGTPAFDRQVPLTLVSARQDPGSNNALLVYTP